MSMLYIGMDGGGTHTTAVAAAPDGHVLSRASGPGLNWLNDGLDACVRRFGDLVSSLLEQVKEREDGSSLTVCAGLAALDGPADPEVLAAFQSVLPPGSRLILESDLSVALAGLTSGKPGLIAVCGTGSMVLCRNNAGRELSAGGWGWKVGDPGSGYMLAREGLFQGLFRLQTEGRETPLLQAALSYFSVPDAQAMIPALYATDRDTAALAAFGAEVLRLADQGATDAHGILSRQMEQLALLAASLLASTPEAAGCVGLFGGVFQHSELARSLFSEALAARCPGVYPHILQTPPAVGAVILAMQREGRKDIL